MNNTECTVRMDPVSFPRLGGTPKLCFGVVITSGNSRRTGEEYMNSTVPYAQILCNSHERDLPKTSGRFQRQENLTIPALKARQEYNSPVTASADASTIPALKARQEYSPGQRPGNKMFPGTASPERAQHIHRNLCVDMYLCISTVSPLQGYALVATQHPGRCLGLYYHCPSRASGSRTIRSVAWFEGVTGFLEGSLRRDDNVGNVGQEIP